MRSYYIGEFPVHNLETYRFNIEVAIEGEDEPLIVKFKQPVLHRIEGVSLPCSRLRRKAASLN